MNGPTFNAQFWALDFRMIDLDDFGKFTTSRAFSVYMYLRRYVWRSKTTLHPNPKVNELFRQGFLVCSIEHARIAQRLDIKDVAQISSYVTELISKGVVRKIATGRGNIYVLGEWKDYSKHAGRENIIENFYLENEYGVDNRPQIDPENPDLAENANPALDDLAEGAKAGEGIDAKAGLGKVPSNNREPSRNRESNTPQVPGGGSKPTGKGRKADTWEDPLPVYYNEMRDFLKNYREAHNGKPPPLAKREAYYLFLKTGEGRAADFY